METKSPSAFRTVLFWLFGGTAFTTLIFFTSTSDPFNAVKFWALLLLASTLVGKTILNFWTDWRLRKTSKVEMASLLLVGLFLLALLIVFITTDVKFIGLFGAYQRRTGFLAYLGFAIVFLSAAKLTKLEKVVSLQVIIFGAGSLMSFYGLLQHFKHDFVKWNNPYNPILTTLGNPDFSSAVLGIFVVSMFGLFMNIEISRINRVISASLGILMLVVIKFSAVTQGFLAAAVGCGFIFVVWVY